MCRPIFLFLAIAIPVFAAQAAPSLDADRIRRLELSGQVNVEMVAQILAAVASQDGRTVQIILNSHGGYVSSARAIIGLIDVWRDRGTPVVTHVPSYARCLSACVMIYAAGQLRTAGPTAFFGLHAIRDAGDGTIATDGASRLRAYFEQRGVDRAWISTLKRSGALGDRRMVLFWGPDLIESGLVTRLVN